MFFVCGWNIFSYSILFIVAASCVLQILEIKSSKRHFSLMNIIANYSVEKKSENWVEYEMKVFSKRRRRRVKLILGVVEIFFSVSFCCLNSKFNCDRLRNSNRDHRLSAYEWRQKTFDSAFSNIFKFLLSERDNFLFFNRYNYIKL